MTRIVVRKLNTDDSLSRARLLSYAEYEYKLTNDTIIPLLKRWGVDLENKKLIDIGCGPGGGCVAFAELGCLCDGSDIDEKLIKFAINFAKERNTVVTFFVDDICNSKILNKHEYDIVIFRDVIEHVHDPKGALTNIYGLLREKGLLCVSFPPFYSPFGGHQHDPRAITRFMPYVHLLPNYIFFRLLPKNKRYREFVKTVKSNNMSIAKFEELVTTSRFRIHKKELYLLRPAFKLRYRIPTINAGVLYHVPFIREFITTGCYYLLRKM